MNKAAPTAIRPPASFTTSMIKSRLFLIQARATVVQSRIFSAAFVSIGARPAPMWKTAIFTLDHSSVILSVRIAAAFASSVLIVRPSLSDSSIIAFRPSAPLSSIGSIFAPARPKIWRASPAWSVLSSTFDKAPAIFIN